MHLDLDMPSNVSVASEAHASNNVLFLQLLEGGLSRVGVPYSYGFAIIVLTLLVKLATFPLSKKSVSSTTPNSACPCCSILDCVQDTHSN